MSPIETPNCRIVIVDDDRLARDGLRGILASVPDLEVVAEARDGETGIEAAREHRPDLVFMDIRMPGIGGIEATRLLQAIDTTVVAMTSFESDDVVLPMLEAGAVGFIVKDASPRELIAAARAAHAGNNVLSPPAAAQLRRMVSSASTDAVRQAASQRFAALSERERDIAVQVATGASNEEISTTLHISMSTMKTHLEHTMQKLGVRNRVLVGVFAERAGFGPQAL